MRWRWSPRRRRDETGGNAPISARYVTVACVFVTCLILSNILAVKLLEFHGRVLDAGNVVFPVSYIIGDVLTEVWGFRAARRVIWTASAATCWRRPRSRRHPPAAGRFLG
jgi:Uncharacterized conserved protein